MDCGSSPREREKREECGDDENPDRRRVRAYSRRGREHHAAAGTSCDALAALKLPDTTITLARAVEAGTFAPPASGSAQAGGLMTTLPAFCRVAATLKPSSDSDIKVEVWLPASGWNGKLQAVGNGGWAGTISYPAMAQALRRGYATTSTDTGHSEPGGAFTLGHPEKFIDFAYRSEHEMTVAAKAVVNAYYGSAPKYLVLEWVLDRRSPGAGRSAALPERLRRRDRRRASQSTNTPERMAAVDCAMPR